MSDLIIPTLIVSTLAFIMSLTAVVLVLAQRFSTHKIEWKPIEFNGLSEEEKFKEEEDVQLSKEDEFLAQALSLSKKAKRKKDEDPLDEILATNNF